MRFACRSVGAEFFEAAPWRFRASAELSVSAQTAFAVFEDPASWPQWFTGIRGVEWTSPKPYGVGTTRTVRLATASVFEHFFRWDAGSRISFCLVAHDAPIALFRALAEDYLLEPLGGERCRFTYSVGIDPALPLRITGPLGRSNLGSMFKAAPAALARYVTPTRT